MDIFYLGIVISLFVLTVFNLYVGVSNDAVNFLNSAIGSKTTTYRTIAWVAAIGVFLGCALSNGMMDIARHGIFHPTYFSFQNVMIIFVSVMVTNVVLLDVFNSFGMPTSTTVSMVFELLGAAFAITVLKMMSGGEHDFGTYLNNDKAIQVILGIFLSVPIAFIFGWLVQYITRLIFTFSYKDRLRYAIGLFGGVAITSIFYFMLFKGLKDMSFMKPELKSWIYANTSLILGTCLVVFTLLCQVLHWLRVNVFTVIIFLGTISLAMAFAGNDLVNFIGVPLAGYESFLDFTQQGAGNAQSFMMSSLQEPASTPVFFLFIAGVIMVVALMTSPKAQRVTKTEVGLSAKQEGEELFGSSAAARSIVRIARRSSSAIGRFTPEVVTRWIDSRFQPVPEDPRFAGAAYDQVRASVNLCMASLLIALGTSLKLPLSTTFVTFMIAMGTSLADRAWTRESAVFRITGVLSVIGGWFLTAGAAFTAAALVAIAMYYGGMGVMYALVALSIYLVVRSQIKFSKQSEEVQQGDTLFQSILVCEDEAAVNTMLAKHISVSTAEQLDFFAASLSKSTDGFFAFALRPMRQVERELNACKRSLKNLRRRETLCLRRVDDMVGTRLSTPFHLLHNDLRQTLSGLTRINDPALEHVDNNFEPVDTEYALRFTQLRNKLTARISEITQMLREERIDSIPEHMESCDEIREEFRAFRHEVLDAAQRKQSKANLTTVNLFLHIIQETEQVAADVHSAINNLRRYYQVM